MAGIALLTTSIVGCNRGTPEERGDRIVQKVTEELDLTAIQQASLTQVKNELLEMRNTISSSREQTQADIWAMLKQPRLDRNQANSMVNQRIEAIHSRSPAIIDAMGNFYDSLDDLQRAELREFIEDRMEHRHGRHFWN